MISGTRMLFFFEELPPSATFPPTLRGLARRQSTNDDHARYPPSHTLQQPRPEYQYTVAVNLPELDRFPSAPVPAEERRPRSSGRNSLRRGWWRPRTRTTLLAWTHPLPVAWSSTRLRRCRRIETRGCSVRTGGFSLLGEAQFPSPAEQPYSASAAAWPRTVRLSPTTPTPIRRTP